MGEIVIDGALEKAGRSAISVEALAVNYTGVSTERFYGPIIKGWDKSRLLKSDMPNYFTSTVAGEEYGENMRRDLFVTDDNQVGLYYPITVTFTSPGDGASYTQTVPKGRAYALEASRFSRTGWKQTGWSTGSTVYGVGDSPALSGSVTLVAMWERNKYNVYYETRVGGINFYGQEILYGETVTIISTQPSWDGHVFKGWATSVSPTTVAYTAGDTFVYDDTRDTYLYAVWETQQYDFIFTNVSGVTLSDYDGNNPFTGESGSVVCDTDAYTVTMTYDEAKALLLPYATKPGYVFDGWDYRTRILDPDSVLDVQELNPTAGGQFWFEAVFTPEDYTASFDGNGGTVSATSTGLSYLDTLTLPGLDTVTTPKEYSRLTGWQIGGEATVYAPGAQIEYSWTKNVTFKAVWTRYSITVKPDLSATGGTLTVGDAEGITYLLGESIQIGRFTVEKAGYTFGGWRLWNGTSVHNTTFIEPQNAAYQAVITAVMAQENLTDNIVPLYPVFTANTNTRYTVQAYVEGGSGVYSHLSDYDLTKYGTTDTMTSAEDFKAEQLNSIPNNIHYVYSHTKNVNIDGSGNAIAINYYARSYYEYIFDADGGTFTDGSTQYVIYARWGANIYSQFPTYRIPVRAGYKYNGWFTEQNGGGTQVTSFSSSTTMPEGGKTVYAYWTAKTVTKIGLPDGFGLNDTQTYYVGEDARDFTVTIEYDGGTSHDTLSSLDAAFKWVNFDTSAAKGRTNARLAFKRLDGSTIYGDFYYEVLPKEVQADLTMSQREFDYSAGLLPIDLASLIGGGSGDGEFSYSVSGNTDKFTFDAAAGWVTELTQAGFSFTFSVTKAGDTRYNPVTTDFTITVNKGTLAPELSIEGLADGENPVFGKRYKLRVSGHGVTSSLIKSTNAGTGTATGTVLSDGTISIIDRGENGTLVVRVEQEATIWYKAYDSADNGNFVITFDRAPATDMDGFALPSGLMICVDRVSGDVDLPAGWAWDETAVSFTEARDYTVNATYTPTGNNYAPTTQELTVTATAHDWTETVDAKYQVSAATTESPAVYSKSCSVCGDAHPTETFTHGYPLRTVTFEAGTGKGITGSVPESETVEHGSQYTLPAADGLTRAGFEFKGWKSKTHNDVWKPGDKVTVNSDLTMVAQWTLLAPVITYTQPDITRTYDKTYDNVNCNYEKFAYIEGIGYTGLTYSSQWYKLPLTADPSSPDAAWQSFNLTGNQACPSVGLVADSGYYRLIVTVTYGNDSVSATSRAVRVQIDKATQTQVSIREDYKTLTYEDGLKINFAHQRTGGCGTGAWTVTAENLDGVAFTFDMTNEWLLSGVTQAGGTFDLVVKKAGDDNYLPLEQRFNITLNKGTRTIEILSDNDNPVFGDKCSLSLDGILNGLVTYEIVEGGTATGAILSFSNLALNTRGAEGTINVKATVRADDLFEEATATRLFTFAKGQAPERSFDNSDFTYDGDWLFLDRRGGGGYTYTLDPADSEYAEFNTSNSSWVKIKKAGVTIHVTRIMEESENYLEKKETFAINILKGTRTLSVTDRTGLTFGDSVFINVTGVKDYRELTFAIKAGGGTAMGEITSSYELRITDRGTDGTITVIVSAPENDLYLASEPVEKQFIFAKASHTAAPEWREEKPQASYTVCVGKSLEDIPLPSYWAWKSGQTLKSTEGNYNVKAIFTPVQSNNYDGWEWTINVTVVAHTGGKATCMEQATCTRCGDKYGEFGGHDYGEAWVSNGNGTHSHVCALNSDHKSEPQNCSGGTATCTAKATCQHCSAEYGEIDGANHNYSEDWTTDENEHWHVCQNDNSHHSATEPHTGGTATCSAKAVCTVCKNEYGTLLDHNYDDEWHSDENGHWHICTVGGEAGTVTAHTPDRDAPTETEPVKCTVCDYIVTPATGYVTHTPDEVWHSDGEKHWHNCTGCEEKLNIATHSGGSATCEHKAECEICNAAYGDLADHTYGEWQTYDGSQHKRVCSVNAAHIEYVNHDWNEGEITTAPTHTTAGEKTFTCTVCGETKTEPVSALTDHTYDREVVEAKYLKSEADCTSPAVYFKSCICGEKGTETFENGDALGHDYGTWTVTTAATCETAGVETRTCSHDNSHTETRAIAALGHNYVFTETVAPNLEAQTDGYDLYTCSNDPSHTEQRNIVAWETLIPKVTVTVSGGSIEGASGNTATVNKDGSVTVIAAAPDEGKVFKGWKVGDEIVSTNATYTFNASADITLTAVYEDAVITPPDDDKPGLSGGAIAGIAVGGSAAAALGGFSIFWFGFKKRRFTDLFKRKK